MAALDWSDIREAARILRNGGLVAMPTETVYGLAADACNDAAVARIFEAKGRPSFNPLIIHVADAAMAREIAEWPPLAEKFAREFWPGPLTMVLPRKAGGVSLLASAGLDTIGVRCPDHDVARALLSSFSGPLAAPSANRSGAVSPTRPEHVAESLGDKVELIMDGGACRVGLESTIVKIDGDRIFLLRPGAVTKEMLEATLGQEISSSPAAAKPLAPGMLDSHYAPAASVRMNVDAPNDNEAFLAFGEASDHPYALNLSPAGDLTEAAANLFSHLRALDDLCRKKSLAGIAAAPIPETGLGVAINDRLRRASAPR